MASDNLALHDIEVPVTLTLDQIDALVKTVGIAKDNCLRKMQQNMENTGGRAYQTAARDFELLVGAHTALATVQAKAYLP